MISYLPYVFCFRVNPIYSEAEDTVAGRSKASSSGYGSQRGSGGGSMASRPPPSRHLPLDPRHVPHPIWPLEDPYNLYSTYSRRPPSTRSNILLRNQVYQAPSDSSYRSGTGRGDRFLQQLLTTKEGIYAAASDGYSSRSDTGRHLDTFIARHQKYLKQQASEKGEPRKTYPTRRISVTDASEVNYITKEFEYLMKLNDLSDARTRRRKEREKYNSYRSRKSSRDELKYVSRRTRRAKENNYVTDPRDRKSGTNSVKSDSDSSLKTIKNVKNKISQEKTIEEVVTKPASEEKSVVKKDKPEEIVRKESDVYFDSLQADPFLLYSHFIAEEESKTQTSSVRNDSRTNVKSVPSSEKTDTGYLYVSDGRSGSDDKTKIKDINSDINSVKEPDKILSDAEYTTIADVERDSDGKLVQLVRRSQIDGIRDEIQSGSMTVERENYLRALLEDVASALEEALEGRDGRRAPQSVQSGVLKEARERVAMGLVALRRAGPDELRDLSTALARGPARPVVRAIAPPSVRAPSPHARKPSLWQQYYMRAHSIHSLDSVNSCYVS